MCGTELVLWLLKWEDWERMSGKHDVDFSRLKSTYNKWCSKFNVYFESHISSFKVAKVRLRNQRATALLKRSRKLLRILFNTYEDLDYFTSTYQYWRQPERTFIPIRLMCPVDVNVVQPNAGILNELCKHSAQENPNAQGQRCLQENPKAQMLGIFCRLGTHSDASNITTSDSWKRRARSSSTFITIDY